MDASRFQGLAVRPSCNISGCPHKQLQFFPGHGPQKLIPGLVVHHGRKNRGRGTVVRASITTDVAAVAVAAATVLPVCWLYINRHKSSPTPASASFSPPVSNSVESAGISTSISKSSAVLVEPAILSTPKVSDGSTYTASIAQFTEVLTDLSLEDWISDDETESKSEENRSLSGFLASTSTSDDSTTDYVAAYGETVLHAPVAQDGVKELEIVLPSSTYDIRVKHSTADDRSKLDSVAEVNGTHVSSEGEIADTGLEHLSNLNGKAELRENLSVPFTGRSDVEKPINGTGRLSNSAESVQSDDLDNDGIYEADLAPIVKPVNGDVPARSTTQLKSPEDICQEGSATLEEPLQIKMPTNGTLHISDTTEVPGSLSKSRAGKFDALNESVGDGSELNTRLRSIIQRELTNIEEKRAELEKSLNSSSDVSIRSVNGKVTSRFQEGSFNPLEASTGTSTKRKSSDLGEKFEGKNHASTLPVKLSEVLPIEKHADPDRYLRIYRSFLSSGRLQDCVLLLEEMDKSNILDTGKIHHSKFFKACQSRKSVKEAFRFLRLIDKPTLSTYNMLISVCRDARDVDGGLRALSAAEKAGQKPDAILYTTLISTCAKAGKLDIAFKVFHQMEAAGVKANIQTYGSIIDGCARAGQIAKAFGVYGIMLSKPVKADLAIFNTLINACGRAGAIERAFDVFADLKAEPYFLTPNHVTYGALISACARAGQVDRAFEVYRSMRQGKKKGTPECYTAAVHACSHTGDLTLARTVLEDMKTDGVQPDEIFFSALIDVAGHANEVDGAFEILDAMKQLGLAPKSVTYSAVMGMCSNTGNWERALKVYQNVKESGLPLTTSTFNALITALSNAKRIQQAFAVLEEMKARGVMPDQITYSILLEACETLDEPDRAFDLYTNARAEGVVPNQSMCDSIIGICYSSLRKRLKAPEYTSSIGLVSGLPLGAPYEQWTTWALSVYRQTVAAGVTPTIKSLSLLLGCLRTQETQREKSIFDDTLFSPYDSAVDLPASLLDGDGLYDPRALALFDEAAAMGIVQRFNYTAGPMTLNAETMPSYVAEVSLLTLLRGLRKRHSVGAQLFPVTIIHFVQKKQTLTATREVKEVSLSGRSGQVMAALLRRLKIHYSGHESSGKLKIAVASIRKWLKPTTPSELPVGNQAKPGWSQIGPRNVFVAKGIAEQQRAIRIGEGQGRAPNVDFRSTNPSTDLYLRQISQIREWEFRDDDFEAEHDSFPRNEGRPTSRVNGLKRPQSLSVKAVNETTRKPRP